MTLIRKLKQRKPRPVTDVCIPGISVPVRIVRYPEARTLRLRLDVDGSCAKLSIPPRLPISDAIAFVEGQAGWLAERLAQLSPHVPFASGMVLPLQGSAWRIEHDAHRRGVRRLEDEKVILVGGSADQLSPRLERWLRAEARSAIASLAMALAARIGRTPGGIAIRDPRSRWGSCSASGTLSFSWRLVMAPPDVLDYVVAHEVSHLRHRDHGPAFWTTVAELAGDYSDAQRWLRDHGAALHRYG